MNNLIPDIHKNLLIMVTMEMITTLTITGRKNVNHFLVSYLTNFHFSAEK